MTDMAHIQDVLKKQRSDISQSMTEDSDWRKIKIFHVYNPHQGYSIKQLHIYLIPPQLPIF